MSHSQDAEHQKTCFFCALAAFRKQWLATVQKENIDTGSDVDSEICTALASEYIRCVATVVANALDASQIDQAFFDLLVLGACMNQIQGVQARLIVERMVSEVVDPNNQAKH